MGAVRLVRGGRHVIKYYDKATFCACALDQECAVIVSFMFIPGLLSR